MQELNGDGPLSAGTRAFLAVRGRQALFDYVHEKLRVAKSNGLTQEKLARFIGKDTGRLSNTLSSPGNWGIDTIALLLFGIAREEIVPGSRPLLGRPSQNMRALDMLDTASPPAQPTHSSRKPIEVKLVSEPRETEDA